MSVQKLLLISVLVVGVFGIMPSLQCSDWSWFSRSGALLVIFGAYFAWADFLAEIKKTFEKERSKIDDETKQKKGLLEDNSFGEIVNPEYASNLIEKQEKEALSVVASEEKLKVQLYRNVEIFIMVLGTLIWAYGDLVNKVS